MPLKMSAISTKEYIFLKKKTYRRLRKKKEKSQFITEIVETTGYSRKQVIRILHKTKAKLHHITKRGRPEKFSYEDKKIISDLWFLMGQPCSTRLKAMLPEWLTAWQIDYGKLKTIQVKRLCEAAASTIDKVIAIKRSQSRQKTNWSQTIAKNAGIETVPSLRKEQDVGHLSADTVAHCGGSMYGSFAWSLTVTDIATQWTENRAVWNKGQYGVCKAFDEIFNSVPFTVKSINTDNGSEFINHHLQRYWKEKRKEVKIMRSRPRHKNDNAHAEQKNRTHVRELFDDYRFEYEELVECMNAVYKPWNELQNFFMVRKKLIKRERIGEKLHKTYDQNQSAYQRMLLQDIGKERKEALKKRKQELNPIRLHEEIEAKLKELFDALNRMQRTEDKK